MARSAAAPFWSRKVTVMTPAIRTALLASTATGLWAGVACAQDYTQYGIKADVPGICSYAAIDAKDYSGRTLNIITHARLRRKVCLNAD